MPSVVYSTERYENNRAEVSHQPTRQRGNASDQCDGSNLPVKHNGSCQCTDSSETFSTWAVTCCERSIIGSYGGRSFLTWDAVTIAA